MTIYAMLYLLPAFAGYYWSFRLLFCKEKVMTAQWILMGGVFLTSVAATLYSTYFNTHFQKEHILCFLYTSTAVITPPVFTFGIIHLNQGRGVPLRNRLIFIPSVLNIASIFLIGTLGGLKRYQRFLATAVHGGDLERNDEGKMVFEDSEEEGRFIDNLAYTCGYPSRASFYLGFNQVMGRSFPDWLKEL